MEHRNYQPKNYYTPIEPLDCPSNRRRRRKENPNSVTEWHNADELVRVILDCGGKRSATPLSDRRKSGVALRLPPQSKAFIGKSLIFSRDVLLIAKTSGPGSAPHLSISLSSFRRPA